MLGRNTFFFRPSSSFRTSSFQSIVLPRTMARSALRSLTAWLQRVHTSLVMKGGSISTKPNLPCRSLLMPQGSLKSQKTKLPLACFQKPLSKSKRQALSLTSGSREKQTEGQLSKQIGAWEEAACRARKSMVEGEYQYWLRSAFSLYFNKNVFFFIDLFNQIYSFSSQVSSVNFLYQIIDCCTSLFSSSSIRLRIIRLQQNMQHRVSITSIAPITIRATRRKLSEVLNLESIALQGSLQLGAKQVQICLSTTMPDQLKSVNLTGLLLRITSGNTFTPSSKNKSLSASRFMLSSRLG